MGVLLGNGDGTFQPVVTYGTGGPADSEAFDVAVADVNRDGKPDLIVANSGNIFTNDGGSVAVLLGNGDGTFQPAVAYSSGGGDVMAVAVADVNGDGNPDLLATDYWGYPANTVSVLLGNGDGTFQPAVTYGSGGASPTSIAVADLNGDNKPDLVVANQCFADCSGAGSVAVLLGNGDGTFQPAVAYDPGGTEPDAVAVADVNGDGKLDIVVANAGGSVAVLLGNGDGTFQPAITYGAGGTFPFSLAVADLNGDNKPDLVVRESDEVGVLLQSGTPVALASSLNPAAPHKVVTYTASVTSQDGGAVTGTVTFRDGGSTLATVPLANNQAAYSTALTKSGPHALTAIYSGDAHNTPGISKVLTEYIESDPSKTVLATSGSPSLSGSQ